MNGELIVLKINDVMCHVSEDLLIVIGQNNVLYPSKVHYENSY